MYYPSQSPGLKLAHEHNPWSRPPYGAPGAPGSGGPPTSPGFPLYPGGMHLHHPGAHAHPFGGQAGLTHPGAGALSHYTSPQNGHVSHAASPGQAEIPPAHWQSQLMKCDHVRNSRSPHHRARQNAMHSRQQPKQAIAIMPPKAEAPKDADGASAAGTSSAVTSPNTPSIATHPSATAAPIAEEPQRPSARERPPANTWTSLDMGGVGIKHLAPSSGVFAYAFLVTLYLNHNQLSAVPGVIGRLRHLELLDLSGNQLSSVPPELGMLTRLKELYLFDNNLPRIPHELGTLHQLQTLGVEGNPLDANQMGLIQKEGTAALIAHLRDTCPLPLPPPDRVWVSAIPPAEQAALADNPDVERFTVLSYNILCEKAATEKMYGYTATWALKWEYRKGLILKEIHHHNADFVCLQEVDQNQYEGHLVPALTFGDDAEYESVYFPKGRHRTMSTEESKLVDGCAIFYRKSKYTLVENILVDFRQIGMQRHAIKSEDLFNRVAHRDHIGVVCLFEHRDTGSRLIVANTHLFWDPTYRDVKLVQVALMLEELERIAHNFARLPPRPPRADGAGPAARAPPTYADGSKIPLVLAIDANSSVESGVYELLSSGKVEPTHADFMTQLYGAYTTEGIRHRLGLKSAYAATGELPMTNYTSNFKGVLDFVFYSTQNLAVTAVLGEIDKGYLDKVVGFPNAHFPSDHIAIMSEFRVKPPRSAIPMSSTSTAPPAPPTP